MISRNQRVTTSSIDKEATRFRLPSAWFPAFVILSILFGGCSSSPDYELPYMPESVVTAYLADKPEPLRPLYRKALLEGQRNLVLNHMRAGLAAMELGEFELAERSFDIALLNIESVYADNPNAARAKSLWYEEGRKDFKGEPYERAMAYYYRGLLYLRRGDFENARASFKGGLLQDAFAEQEVYRADFALLVFLEGWASRMLGDEDMAQESFREVKQHRPDFVPPGPDDNVLLIAETGTAPIKLAVGKGQSALVFRPGLAWEKSVRFRIGGSVFKGYTMEDIYWQANTRGGREVDKILAGKVQFRDTNERMGRTLTDLSLQTLAMSPQFGDDSGAVAIAAGVMGLVGLGQRALAARTRTRADARSWDNLPDRVQIFTLHSESGDQGFECSFFAADGSELPRLHKKGKIYFVNDRFGFAWVRSRSALVH